MLIPLTGTFPGWPAAPQPSVAHWLFVVIGIPAISMVIVGVLAAAGSLAKRGRGGTDLAEPVWYGQTAGDVAGATPRAELTADPASQRVAEAEQIGQTGGASVRW